MRRVMRAIQYCGNSNLVAVIVLGLLAATPAISQSSMAEYDACFRSGGGDTTTLIFACSRMSGDSSQPPEMRGEALRIRGQAYSVGGRQDQGITDLTEAIRLDPNSYKALVSRGFAYIRANNTGLAGTDLRKPLPMMPPGSDRDELTKLLQNLKN